MPPTLSKDDWRDCSRPRYLNGHDHAPSDIKTVELTFPSQSEAEEFIIKAVEAGLLKLDAGMMDA